MDQKREIGKHFDMNENRKLMSSSIRHRLLKFTE